MTENTANNEPLETTAKSSDTQTRKRSQIEFPYSDLSDAEKVANAVYQNAGTSCETHQLAGYLGQSVDGGSFRLRVSTARTFGLTINEAGRVTLTALGRDIVDGGKQLGARVNAFLNVPLYRAIFDQYKGTPLPPAAGLEAEMERLGVAPKQKEKARQVFMRSAQQAGFFSQGKERLVLPSGLNLSVHEEPPKDPKVKGGGEVHTPSPTDPIIQSLINRLPAPDSEWPVRERIRWLEAVMRSMEVIYKQPDDSRIKIVIENDE